ncbi:MAG: hypothetical protein AB7N80_05610 [Bdellovibrionales bacterium]
MLKSLLLILLTLPFVAEATDILLNSRYDELEGAILVKQLLKEEKLQVAYEQVRLLSKQEKSKSLGLEYWIRAEIAYQSKKWHEAQALMVLAISARMQANNVQIVEVAELRWMQARIEEQMGNFNACAEFVDEVEGFKSATESDLWRAYRCYVKISQVASAWGVLKWGEKNFSVSAWQYQQVNLLFSQHIQNEAFHRAQDLIARPGATASQAIGLAEIFSSVPQLHLELLELARLRWPADPLVLQALIAGYYQRGWLQAVTDLFATLARQRREFNFHAAELLRQRGKPRMAQWYALQIPDDTRYLRFQLAQAVDQDQWPLAASLDSNLSKTPVLESDEARYAVAFGLANVGEFERARVHLQQIKEPAFVKRAFHLTKEINSKDSTVQN